MRLNVLTSESLQSARACIVRMRPGILPISDPSDTADARRPQALTAHKNDLFRSVGNVGDLC